MNIYLDTSFLVSLYGTDANSAAAVQVIHTAGALFLTTFAELEVVKASGLRVFRKEVAPAQAQSSLNDFEQDLRAGGDARQAGADQERGSHDGILSVFPAAGGRIDLAGESSGCEGGRLFRFHRLGGEGGATPPSRLQGSAKDVREV